MPWPNTLGSLRTLPKIPMSYQVIIQYDVSFQFNVNTWVKDLKIMSSNDFYQFYLARDAWWYLIYECNTFTLHYYKMMQCPISIFHKIPMSDTWQLTWISCHHAHTFFNLTISFWLVRYNKACKEMPFFSNQSEWFKCIDIYVCINTNRGIKMYDKTFIWSCTMHKSICIFPG